MKAQLQFNLEDLEDLNAIKRCIQSDSMALILWELVHNSKKKLEWAMESDTISRYDALDMVFERINDLLEEHGINIDKITF